MPDSNSNNVRNAPRWLGLFSRLLPALPARFVKFALVGFAGMFVNLGSLALIIKWAGLRDWRASASATLIAIVNNYFLNNFWTFRDRLHKGVELLSGSVIYFAISLVGLAITAAAYSGLIKGYQLWLNPAAQVSNLSVFSLLVFQFFSALCGAVSNYILNFEITWRSPEKRFWRP